MKNISQINNEKYSTVADFGFFKDIVSVSTDIKTIIKNIEFNIIEVTATQTAKVGAVAGSISNTVLCDVNVTAESEASVITGRNFAGGIAGYINNVQAYNCLNQGVSVVAEFAHGTVENWWIADKENNYTLSSDAELSSNTIYNNYSYAGGLFGVTQNSSLNKLTASSKLQVRAENAGGVIGYADKNTTLKDIKFVAILDQVSTDYSQGIYGSRNAGGIVAHLEGTLQLASLDFEQEKQATADTNAMREGNNNGISNLFDRLNFRTGALVGYLTDGSITNSYSRVDVRNANSHIVGGLVGEITKGSITNCYTTSSVYGNRKVGPEISLIMAYIGGVAGKITGELTISNVVALNNWNRYNTVWNTNLYNFDEFSAYIQDSDKVTCSNCYVVQKTLNGGVYEYDNTTNIKGYTYTQLTADATINTTIFTSFSDEIWNKTGVFPRFKIYQKGTNTN